MKTYCIKCRKRLKILTQKQLEQKILDQLCNQNILLVELRNQDLLKEQEAKGLLSNLEFKTRLSKIPLLNVLF